MVLFSSMMKQFSFRSTKSSGSSREEGEGEQVPPPSATSASPSPPPPPPAAAAAAEGSAGNEFVGPEVEDTEQTVAVPHPPPAAGLVAGRERGTPSPERPSDGEGFGSSMSNQNALAVAAEAEAAAESRRAGMDEARERARQYVRQSTADTVCSLSGERGRNVIFHLTGFGAFHKVECNPTTLLMQRLPDALALRKRERGGSSSCSVASYTILEVSAVGCSPPLKHLHASVAPKWDDDSGTGTAIVYIHCGVDAANTTGFKLEQCAYNQACFRVPDVRGLQLDDEVIIPDNEKGHCYRTDLPLEAIRENLDTVRGWGDKVAVSTDAGRFVCNLAYYRSLHLCHKRKEGKEEGAAGRAGARALDANVSRHVLFLHVPPESAVCIEEQSRFVMDLMDAIELYVKHL